MAGSGKIPSFLFASRIAHRCEWAGQDSGREKAGNYEK
jgi:hypothetical protein